MSILDGREPFLPLRPDEEFPIEQAAIVDDEGRIVLFYRQYYVPHESQPVEYHRTATEVPGSDGTEFRVDAGERHVTVADVAKGYIDALGNPDVFRDPEGYVIYCGSGVIEAGSPESAIGNPDIGGLGAWRSETLRDTYAPVEGLSSGILTTFASGGCGYYDPVSDEYWTYVIPPGRYVPGRTTIWRAVHDRVDSPLGESDFEQVIDFEELVGLERTYLAPGAGLLHLGFISNEPDPDHFVVETEEKESEPSGSDRDGDGVPDDEDLCPDWPGSEGMSGC